MIAGEIVQYGTPRYVYDFPASVAVAEFLGSPPMNLISSDGVVLGIRPEHVRLHPEGQLEGEVVRCETMGADSYIEVRTPQGSVTARIGASGDTPETGESVRLLLPEAFLRRFDGRTGKSID